MLISQFSQLPESQVCGPQLGVIHTNRRSDLRGPGAFAPLDAQIHAVLADSYLFGLSDPLQAKSHTVAAIEAKPRISASAGET
jgi:hypothetical protein